MSDVLVFIPAWNEESNLPGVLEELAAELPDADAPSSTTDRRMARRRSLVATAPRW
jgi:hypothetical protein